MHAYRQTWRGRDKNEWMQMRLGGPGQTRVNTRTEQRTRGDLLREIDSTLIAPPPGPRKREGQEEERSEDTGILQRILQYCLLDCREH